MRLLLRFPHQLRSWAGLKERRRFHLYMSSRFHLSHAVADMTCSLILRFIFQMQFKRYEHILVPPGPKPIVEEKFTLSYLQQSSNPVYIHEQQELQIQETIENERIQELERMRHDKEEAQFRLEQEQQRCQILQEELENAQKRLEGERYALIDQIAEAHQAEQELREAQVKRMSEKNAKLTRMLMREQAIKENMAQNNGYSNPAKLMNHLKMKMKKSIANTDFAQYIIPHIAFILYFANVTQYLSHMEAFTKLSNKQTEQERHRQRTLLETIARNQATTIKQPLMRVQSDQKLATGKVQLDETQMFENRVDTLRAKLELQRRTLRDFSTYCNTNKPAYVR